MPEYDNYLLLSLAKLGKDIGVSKEKEQAFNNIILRLEDRGFDQQQLDDMLRIADDRYGNGEYGNYLDSWFSHPDKAWLRAYVAQSFNNENR